MRADRLLSIMMLLQARGRLTAHELASELEVSVRTIYRDIDALSMAGVPVYTERGPGGGCALLDDYRTTLTGLTRDEARALFMLSIPAPLSELGVGHELKVALLKLSAALPPARRGDEERARQRIHLDSYGWFETREAVPHLQTIQKAVWQDRCLRLTCRLPFSAQASRVVAPYGLVAKANEWYLFCCRAGHTHVYRVVDVLDATLLAETFERPAGFDLKAAWQAYCARARENRPRYPVTARVQTALVPWLPQWLGDGARDAIAAAGPPDGNGWLTLLLPFESLEEARLRLLGFGRAVEVLEPEVLRQSVADYAAQIVDLYATSERRPA
ncbi:helix-turn-helix transcriptional regulator [Chloroflexota bacterium]